MPPVIAAVASVVAAVGAAATAIVGAIGLTSVAAALGMSAFTFLATTVAIGYSLLAPKPRAPQNSKENVNRLRASIDPRTARKTVVGYTAMATDIRDEEFTDNQTYFHRFLVVASHKVSEITEIWFDDKVAWTLAGGVQGEFVGYLTVTPILEGSSGNAINISARMGTTRRYTGLAYVYLRYKLTGNTKKTDSPFAQSITTRITVRGKGAYFYDPRLDSTVTGGSGSHRATDQTTWAWDADDCRNPALALLFYLLGWKINGELAVGKGIPANRIDLESFITAANICDELVDIDESTTEPRYRCDGVWGEGDNPITVIEMLKACMNADLDDVDGKLRVTIFTDDTAVSAADFTEADILDEFEWEPLITLDQSFNVVTGSYTDPSDASLYQQVDYPRVEATSPDGIDRIDTFNLPMVESPTQAQRLASLRLQRQQFSGTFKANFQATAWKVEKNSIVRLTFPALGFTNKIFRVAEMDLRVDGVVPLVLREEDPSIYVDPAFTAPVEAVDTTPYDPFYDPIITAINDERAAIRGAIIKDPRTTGNVSRNLLIASDAGATATISVARHDWDYPLGVDDITRELGTITGLAFNTVYYVYFDDEGLDNTAPTYAATTTQATGQNSVDNPFRHPVGMIRTPADGDPDTTEADTPTTGGYPNDPVQGWQLPLIRTALILNPRTAGDVSRTLLIASDAGATATISVAKHDWDYPTGTPDITRALGTITGLAFNTNYYVYFDDATLTNGSPTYAATTVMEDAIPTYNRPGRHQVGLIRTPGDGDPDTSETTTPGNLLYLNDPAHGWTIPLIRSAMVLNPRTTGDVSRDLLQATDAGATATISVARHDWDYPTGAPDITRELATITGLAFNTVYYVYFDDATLANGSPTYAATTVMEDAIPTYNRPGRHPVGAIRTPVDGGAMTVGFLSPIDGSYPNDPPQGWQSALILSANILNPRNTSNVQRSLITATDAGATATISVARHDWDYPGTQPDVTRELGTITGLSFDTVYYVYFVDTALTATAPTYLATTNPDTAVPSTNAPGVHPIGMIRTPRNGGPDTNNGLILARSFEFDPDFDQQNNRNPIPINACTFETTSITKSENADGSVDLRLFWTWDTVGPPAMTDADLDWWRITMYQATKAEGAGVYDFGVIAGGMTDIWISRDGLYVFTTGETTVYQFVLREPGNLETAEYLGSYSATTQVDAVRGIALSSDGTKMYLFDDPGATCYVYQYTLATAWDVTTASYATLSKTVDSEITQAGGLAFKPDGSKVYLCGVNAGGTDYLIQYTLSTPWNISTAGTKVAKNVSSLITDPTGICIGEDGKQFYMSTNFNGLLAHTTLATAWDLSTTMSADETENLSAFSDENAGLAMLPDERTFIILSSDASMDLDFGFQFTFATAADWASTRTDPPMGAGTFGNPYVFGTDPDREVVYHFARAARNAVITSLPSDGYYSFQLEAVRYVDADIDASREILSAAALPTGVYYPYHPGPVVNISGNVGDVPAFILGNAIDPVTGWANLGIINLAEWEEQSATIILNNETYSLSPVNDDITVDGNKVRLTVILPFYVSVSNPTVGDEFYFDIKGWLYDGSTYTYFPGASGSATTDAIRVYKRWVGASASGTQTTERVIATLEMSLEIDGVIEPGDYTYGYAITVPSGWSIYLPYYRYTRIENMRGVE